MFKESNLQLFPADLMCICRQAHADRSALGLIICRIMFAIIYQQIYRHLQRGNAYLTRKCLVTPLMFSLCWATSSLYSSIFSAGGG